MTYSAPTHRRVRLLASLSLAAALASSCAPKFAPPAATGPAKATEGRVSADAFGNIHLDLAGKSFVLKSLDGKPLGNIGIQVAGKYYNTNQGAFSLPGEALTALQDNSHGFFRVFAPGYVPRQVWIGQQGNEIPMVPLTPIKVVPQMFATGGTIAAPQAGLSVTVPAGLLTKSTTPVELSTYIPTPPADPQVAVKERQGFLDKLAKLKAGAGVKYVLAATDPCVDPEAPLPCPPATAGLGVMLTANGPISAGVITNTIDLDVLLKDPTQAPAAQRILQTYAQIDADPFGTAIRGLLQSDYGLSLNGHVLTFAVSIGTQAAIDGFAKVEVQGVDLLGVNMEFTMVSAVNATLPPAATTPGLATLPVGPGGLGNALGNRLISNDGGGLISNDGAGLGIDGSALISQDGGSLIGQDGSSLIGQDGASLISQDGGSLISQDGGSLISNDGGTLVGHVEVPFKPDVNNGKYQLAAAGYTSYPWPGASVRAVTFQGTALSQWVLTDANSNFCIQNMPPTPAYFWVEVKAGPYYLRTLATAMGNTRVIANVNAATTAVASAIYAGIVANPGDAELLEPDHFNDDVDLEASWLNQAAAQAVVSAASIQTIDTTARALWQTKGVEPESFDLHLPAVPPAAPGGAAPPALPLPLITVMTGVVDPAGLAYDAGSQQLYVADTGANKILKYNLAGASLLNLVSPTNIGGTGWSAPAGLALGNGALYVADSGNHVVKQIRPATGGTVSILAGETAVAAAAVDGGTKGPTGNPATKRVHFNTPWGLAIYGKKLYISDAALGQLRMIDLSKNPNGSAFMNNLAAVGAPSVFRGLAIEPGTTNVLVADEGTNTITRYNAGGTAMGAYSSGMSGPVFLAPAPNGDVFFAASGMPHVGKVPAGGGIPTVDYLPLIGGMPRSVVARSANEVVVAIPGSLIDIKF